MCGVFTYIKWWKTMKNGHYFIPIQQNTPIFHPNIIPNIMNYMMFFQQQLGDLYIFMQFIGDSPYSILGAETPTSVETFLKAPTRYTTHVFHVFHVFLVFHGPRWSHSKLYVSNRTQWRRFWYLEPTKSHETSQGAELRSAATRGFFNRCRLWEAAAWLGKPKELDLFFEKINRQTNPNGGFWRYRFSVVVFFKFKVLEFWMEND